MLNLKALRQGLVYMGDQTVNRWLAHPSPREGQIEMIEACLSTLMENGSHLVSAPTGVGKTAAALAAALEYANSCSERKSIMFLTPRQSQHKIVVDTVRKINHLNPNNKISLVDMIGQANMCVEPFAGSKGAMFSLMCSKHRKNRQCRPYLTSAPGFEQRILSDPLHVNELVEMSKTHFENGVKTQTCPWKAARNTAKKADVIVCDYNHLFIEEVRNASLKAMDLSLSDLIIIVDEAHNLADRVRMGMKRTLSPTMVRNAATEVEEHLGNLEKVASIGFENIDSVQLKTWSLSVCKEFRQVLNREFKVMIKEMKNEKEIRIEAKRVLGMLEEAFDATAAFASQSTLTDGDSAFIIPDSNSRLSMFKWQLESNEVDIDEGGDNEPSAHLLAHLLDVLIRFGNTTALCLAFDGEGKDGRIVSNLLDAGLVAGPIFAECDASILMSGTLNPPSMFADLLGIEKTKRAESQHSSPFAKERRPIVVANDVTTLYRERSLENTQKIREHIRKLVENTPGNVAVFVPSYALLNDLFEGFHIPVVKTMIESKSWSKKDIDDLLIQLKDQRTIGRRILLAGVFNGKLSEGVDYHGGLLDSVICVGIPNAPPSVFQKALGDYIKEKFGKGNFWRYANSQPAVNSILQAMGRAIRSMGDRALILLLDKRNLDRTYSICFPSDIKMNQTSNSDATGRFAKRFFDKVPWIEDA